MEQDDYVYPGQRFTENGYCTGQGQGMTLRDWFAATSCAGDYAARRKGDTHETELAEYFIYNTKTHEGREEIKPRQLTEFELRYRYADSMLEARKK